MLHLRSVLLRASVLLHRYVRLPIRKRLWYVRGGLVWTRDGDTLLTYYVSPEQRIALEEHGWAMWKPFDPMTAVYDLLAEEERCRPTRR